MTSVGVLEHVRETGGNEIQSLGEVVRVLRPGGCFVCYHFPNRWSWIDAVAHRIPAAHQHDFRYTRAGIDGLAERAELEIVTHRRYGALPRNSAARLPDRLSESSWFAALFDAIDPGVALLARPICQNHLVGGTARGPPTLIRGCHPASGPQSGIPPDAGAPPKQMRFAPPWP